MLCVVVCCLFTFVFLYVSQLLQCEVAAVGLVEHLLEELFCRNLTLRTRDCCTEVTELQTKIKSITSQPECMIGKIDLVTLDMAF